MINMTVGQRKIYSSRNPEAEAYWRALLAGVAPTSFRPDMTGGEMESAERVSYTATLPDALVTQLRRVSKNNPIALRILLSAAVVMLLRTSTGEEDLLIGTPSTDRQINELIPLRCQVSEVDTLPQVAQRLLQQTQNAQSWLDFPIDLLGYRPQVVIALESAEMLESPDVGMNFSFLDDGLALTLRLSAAGQRFSLITLSRLCEHLLALLTQAMGDSSRPLAEMNLLLARDRTLLDRVNDTHKPYPETSLTALFSEAFRTYADRPALYEAQRTYGYAELDRASDAVALQLRSKGVQANDIVAVVAQRSFAMMAAIIGTLKAGAAYLPVAPDLPASRIDYLLNDSQSKIVLIQPEWASLIPAGYVQIVLTPQVLAESVDFLQVPVSPHDAAYVIYTSGSTGKPKGVVIEHHSVVNRLKWMQSIAPIGARDVILQKTTISFDVSVWELFWWLLEGASLSLLPPGGEKEPALVAAAIERHQVTTMHFVPTMLGAFLEYTTASGEGHRLASLKQVFASGEALGKHHVAAFARLFPNTRLINLYGPTEATVDVSWQVTAPEHPLMTIGQPIDNTRLYVLDHQMRERPVGMTGELYIAGVGLARHYLHRPELTAERFVLGSSVGESRLYKTGDLARWLDNGELEYIGRNDFQVKLRGFRIELGEIEQTLLSVPGITEAAAIVRKSTEGQEKLLAYVISTETFSEQALLAQLREQLPSYMVPERIVFVKAFPLSPSGKLNIAALPEPGTLRSDYVEPRNDAEQRMTEIWSEVLGVERIGVTESFFALGGNSIHFVTVLAKARKLGMQFTFQQLFQYPTIAALILHGGQSAEGDEPPRKYQAFELTRAEDRDRMPADIEDAYPMSMLQAGLIYQSELMHGNTSYHDIVSYLIQGSIDAEVFRKAMHVMVEQNAVFRTSYHLKTFSEYLQLVHRQSDTLPLEIVDVRHLSTDEAQEQWYHEWFAREQGRDFRWETPGLVRLHIHILRNDLYRYSISQHNSALDGWSMNQLHTQLFALYYEMLEGREHQHVVVENHVRNFIGLERHAIQSPAHFAFWQNNMADYPHTTIPRLQASRGDIVPEVIFKDIPLPEGLSRRIIELGQTLGVPVKNVLLAAHLKVHALLNGENDILTGYEHGGRPELPGADHALGVFLNTLPFRVRIEDGSWRDLIQQTYSAEAKLLPYRRYPMAKVKQDLRTKELLFETVFNFTHFYSLKALKQLPEFSLLEVRAAAITEFPLRMEFSQHFYTDEVQVSLHYHAGEFDEEQIGDIGAAIVRILECMTGQTDQSHNDFCLLGALELERLAAFSAHHPESPQLVDRYGHLCPIGSDGYVVTEGQSLSATSPRGRWLADGTLWLGKRQLPNRDDLETTGAASNKPAANPTETVRSANFVASETAQHILRIWSEVLSVSPEDCAAEDDFFEVGGNSLAAMRLVVLLEGAVSLRDMMQYSRLGELIEIAERKALEVAPQPEDNLLVALAGSGQDKGNLICLPYAGGNALNFRPFALKLGERLAGMNIWAVELPGHDPQKMESSLQSFHQVAVKITDEIVALGNQPVYLWGHCVGSVLAIEVTRQLQLRGIRVAHLFLAAKLLHLASEIQQTLVNAQNLHFDDIRELYSEWSGDQALDVLSREAREFMTNVFRHDSLESNRHLLQCLEHEQPLINVPTSLVIAKDDPATEGYIKRYKDWARLTTDIHLFELNEGGHYFMRTEAEKVAELVKHTLF